MDPYKYRVLAHAGAYNRQALTQHPENSIQICEISNNIDYIDIIELDLRKSHDGVLYCYHGNLFHYYITLKLPLYFKTIKQLFQVNTLEEILTVIDTHKTVFLDIKDTSINSRDILQAFKGKSFREVILGNKSVTYLDIFTHLPAEFVKVLNGNILCNFYNLNKLAQKKFKYIEAVFWFQISSRLMQQVKKSGLTLRLSGLFCTRTSYKKTIEKYGITHISSDFIKITHT